MSEIKKTPCEVCDYPNAKQTGRARWVCPKCGSDISFGYLLWYDATHPIKTKETK